MKRLDQRRLFGSYLLPTPSVVFPGWVSKLFRNPAVFFSWLHARRVAFRLRGFPFRQLSFNGGGEPHIQDHVIPHNMEQLWGINSDRTERLMNVFRSLQGLDLSKLRVLCVGPRNEAELLLLTLYGFSLENITAIDLFTYTPRIELMDMHRLDFPADTFDVCYLSYVLTYSDRVDQACREIARVTRDGGLVALSFQHFLDGRVNRFGQNNLSGGLDELYRRFEPHAGYVHFREEFREGDSTTCSTVFRIRKAEGGG